MTIKFEAEEVEGSDGQLCKVLLYEEFAYGSEDEPGNYAFELVYTSPVIYGDVAQATEIIRDAWGSGEYDGAYINMRLGGAGLTPDWDEDGKHLYKEYPTDENGVWGSIRGHRNIRKGISGVENVTIWGKFFSRTIKLFVDRPMYGEKCREDEAFLDEAYAHYKKLLLEDSL